MSYPLEDIKVLDMPRVLAKPFAGRMLCDLIKLEPPEGDISRLWGARTNGQSGFFNQQNTGKRGIAVDLTIADGAALVKCLAAEADILLENFRGGVMEHFGLGWADLQVINPRLIMCSISGFGQVGPESTHAAYAPIIHAEGGLVAGQSRINATPCPSEVWPTAESYLMVAGDFRYIWRRLLEHNHEVLSDWLNLDAGEHKLEADKAPLL